MSQRFIFTYWDALPAMDMIGERILCSLWRKAWEKAGLTPIVLSEWWASQHPIYVEFDKAVSKLPSTNPPMYERACFLRWLAVQVAAKEYPNASGRIVMLDYDVIGYDENAYLFHWLNCSPDEPAWKDTPMLSLHGNCPALVIGTEAQFAEVCNEFLAYDPKGKTHCSDQYIFEDFIIRCPEKFKVSMDVVLYSEPGWETAAACHFSNSVMAPKYIPKHEWIPKLRPV